MILFTNKIYGHDEKVDSFNRGNFLEILNLVAEHDEIVHARLYGVQNANFTALLPMKLKICRKRNR